MKRIPRKPLLAGGGVIVFGVVVVGIIVALAPHPTGGLSGANALNVNTNQALQSTAGALSPAEKQIAALPEARYNTTIAGLMAADLPTVTATMNFSYTLLNDAALYGEDRQTPVARLAATNFIGSPTVVVVVRTDGRWALIITPARQYLPSQHDHQATAETTAWIDKALLYQNQKLVQKVVVSTTAQTLTIENFDGTNKVVFPAGVGTPDTPTPTGITGIIQTRFLDPAQNAGTYPIQLTSLHSAVADNPYGGRDGGLIGVHYNPANTGAISHGCVRLTPEAIKAVNALPLGTPITINQ